MSRSAYNTNSKKLVLNEAMLLNKSFTVKDIKDKLDLNGHCISITTVYRILNSYVEQGVLKRFYNDNNTANYQYLMECNNNNHFYLKCIKCGYVVHVDCDCINSFSKHIVSEHNFNLSNNNMFITGYCDKCSRKDSI